MQYYSKINLMSINQNFYRVITLLASYIAMYIITCMYMYGTVRIYT